MTREEMRRAEAIFRVCTGIIIGAIAILLAIYAVRRNDAVAYTESVVIYHEDGRPLPSVDHPTPQEAPEIHVIENCAITGYCACCTPYSHLNMDEHGRVLVASGQWVNAGYVVAVDPDVIPIGASVIIDNREYYALDTGVTGNVVDILMSHDEASVAGCRYETVKWYVEGE